MTLSPGREQDPSALEEELVAYLDDELDQDTRLRLERRLAEEPAVRETLRKLTRVWDALETLPRAEVSDSFATTTVDAVVLKEQQSQANTFANRLRKSRDWWLRSFVALAGCALVSFIATRLIWPDPNVQLAEDLPILENIKAYRDVETIDFAKALLAANLFVEQGSSTDNAPASAPAANADARLVQLASSDTEKPVIAKNWQEFEGVISDQERQRLRALERALKREPNEAELRRVMLRYNEWLGSLKEPQRAALRDLTDPQARIKRMREIILADLPERDRRTVGEWLEEYARVHEDELVERAKQSPWAERFPRRQNLDSNARHFLAMGAIMQCMMEPGGRENELPFTEYDFAQLESQLSAEPSKRLKELRDVELKKLALAEWWRTMMRENFDRPFRGFDTHSDAQQKYRQLFNGPRGLSDVDKNEIFMQSPEEAKKSLQREWAMRFGGQQFGRPGGFGPPGPPNDERGGRRGGRNRGDRDRSDNDDDDGRRRREEKKQHDESSPSDGDESSNVDQK